MTERFKSAVFEIKSAQEFIPMLTSRVYTQISTKEGGAAARTLLFELGVQNLIFAHNIIARYRNAKEFKTNDTQVSGFAKIKESEQYANLLNIVVAWLEDPFLYDSREEYRGAALANLDKAMVLLEQVIRGIMNPLH